MGGRWLNIGVVGLWLASMSWLVVEKVLPPLWVGEPPSYRSILEARRSEPPVGWRLQWNEEEIGWALSAARALPQGSTEIRSRVHLDYLPLADLVPEWLGRLFRLPEFRNLRLSLDTTSTLMIDPLGRLVRFHGSLQIGSFAEVVHMEGTVEGNDLLFAVRCGEFSYETSVPLPPDALLGDALSPQTRLPGLKVGQKWTVPTVSPLGRWNQALEVLHAKVEGQEPIFWDGKTAEAHVVVFWPDVGGGPVEQKPRGKLWVLPDPDGRVIQQEATFFHSRMQFVRMTDSESARLASQVKLDEMLGEPRRIVSPRERLPGAASFPRGDGVP